jgi:membrane-bound acyltransferase YfiQ involved in biofilm formation
MLDTPVHELHSVKVFSTWIFAIALVHTLGASRILALSHRFAHDSLSANLLHFLGEVEVVFGFWAMVLMGWIAFQFGNDHVIEYLRTVNFTEPVFVFVIMARTATRPIVDGAANLIGALARLIPRPANMAFYCSAIFFGSLLGSMLKPTCKLIPSFSGILKIGIYALRLPV